MLRIPFYPECLPVKHCLETVVLALSYIELTTVSKNLEALGKAMFTLLRILFYPFSFRSVLPVHIAPSTFEYAMKTISVHIAPLQVQRKTA